MNIKNLLDHTRLLKFGNGTDLCHSDYPIKGYRMCVIIINIISFQIIDGRLSTQCPVMPRRLVLTNNRGGF